MQRRKYKGRWEKKKLSKSPEVCRFYSKLQAAYADKLETDSDIVEFHCNVVLDGTNEDYTTDFLCKRRDGTFSVRECVARKQLTWPSVIKLLDMSLVYWRKQGVEDWGIIIEKEKEYGTEG